MTTTTQLNIRIPMQLKLQAQKIADIKGVKLNTLLNYFLRKFVENPDVVQIQHDIEMEKIFDQGVIEYSMSSQGKKQFKEIDALLQEKGIM
jgi:antitoxin component of RelBE/YafQ-DinJ toxin-antitoxin module